MRAPISKVIAPDTAAICAMVADKIVSLALRSTAQSGQFSIALAGGSTPKGVYRLLASEPRVKQMPWERTLIYFGDERHVRPDQPESNYRMAYEAMLQTVPIPTENVFPIPTMDPRPAACAESYERLLCSQMRKLSDGFPVFDLILLGLGNDGHTASLFPGTPAPNERSCWVTWCDPNAANSAVTPAVQRVTLTAPVIWNAAEVFVLAVGAEKAPVVAGIFAENEPLKPPVSRLLRECKGAVTFFLDQQAAG